MKVRAISMAAFTISVMGAMACLAAPPVGKVPTKDIKVPHFKPPRPSNNVMVSLTFTANSSNITKNWALVDDSNLNGRPDLVVMVTQRWESKAGGVYNPHPVGVWYTDGKWSIFNEDRADMPQGAMFNIFALNPGVFAETGAQANQNHPGVTYRLAGMNSLEDLWEAIEALDGKSG